MKKKICFIVVIIIIGCIAAGLCIYKKAQDNVTRQVVSGITSGDIYEITENNFVKGLEYDFSEEELNEITEIWNGDSIQLTKKIPNNDEIVYQVSFYDEAGSEVLFLAIDKDDKIYHGDGYLVKSKELSDFLRKYTEMEVVE